MAIRSQETVDSQGRRIIQHLLLENATDTVQSGWVDISGCSPWTITVGGAFSNMTIQILVSNALTRPSNSSIAEGKIGDDITGNFALVLNAPFRWLNISVVASAPTGAVTVGFMGVK